MKTAVFILAAIGLLIAVGYSGFRVGYIKSEADNNVALNKLLCQDALTRRRDFEKYLNDNPDYPITGVEVLSKVRNEWVKKYCKG